MASIRRKIKGSSDLAMFFLELGKIPTEREYKKLRKVPLRLSTINSMYRKYNNMLEYVKNAQPDLWKEIENLNKPKVVEPKVVKPDPEVTPKPAPKPKPKVVAAEKE